LLKFLKVKYEYLGVTVTEKTLPPFPTSPEARSAVREALGASMEPDDQGEFQVTGAAFTLHGRQIVDAANLKHWAAFKAGDLVTVTTRSRAHEAAVGEVGTTSETTASDA